MRYLFSRIIYHMVVCTSTEGENIIRPKECMRSISVARIATCVKECGAAILLPQNVMRFVNRKMQRKPIFSGFRYIFTHFAALILYRYFLTLSGRAASSAETLTVT